MSIIHALRALLARRRTARLERLLACYDGAGNPSAEQRLSRQSTKRKAIR